MASKPAPRKVRRHKHTVPVKQANASPQGKKKSRG